jgi:hypothetical protein
MLGALLLAVLMTACGGGGGSPGTTVGTGGTGTNPVGTVTASVTDFALFTDKNSITNGGTDKAQLTVVAVDASRNVVPGAAVSVSVDQNGVFTPAGASVTDTSGTFVGHLTIGADKSNRDITLAVTVNNITKQTAVRVTGSKLTLQAVPPTPSPGQTVTLNTTLVDSSGNAIPAATINLGGTVPALQNQTITTNLAGTAGKSFAAPTTSGVYTITASGNGVSAADYQLQVFSSVIPAAVIPAGAAPSLSASPNVLAVNTAGSSTSKSVLRFLFLDAANNPIQNVRVRFVDATTGLAAVGASISSGTSTMYTDTSGAVTAEYIAGQNSSPTNGVTVRACYSSTDFASSTDCPAQITASLTVAGQALAISIGDDNLLEKGSGTYIKRFAVTVADSAGKAVINAPVDISVDLTHYRTGEDIVTEPSWTTLSYVPQDLTAAYPSLTTTPTATRTVSGTTTETYTKLVWCPNEDTNRNGNVDPGENINKSKDTNAQDTLEPRKSDLLVSYANPSVTATNDSGILVIKVEYSQRFATWLAYRVRVTANVAGSQGMAERLFITHFVEGDDKNGSFLSPPYGSGACQVD